MNTLFFRLWSAVTLLMAFPASSLALEETRIPENMERWRGCYYYANETDLVKGGSRFYTDLGYRETGFAGMLYEDSFIKGQEGQSLVSMVMGMAHNDMVSFTKVYDPQSGLSHMIMYLGSFKKQGNEIQGIWTITDQDISGRFIMSRQGYPCDS